MSSKLELLTYGYIRFELEIVDASSIASLIKDNIIDFAKWQYCFGVDLSYSINKKSYNLINASQFNDFCIKSENINDGVHNVNNIISFGDDHYGLIYDKDKEESITGFIFNRGQYNKINESVKEALMRINNYSSTRNNLIISDTPFCQEIVIFDNTISSFKTIELLNKSEKDKIIKDNNYKQSIIDQYDEKEEEKEEKEEEEEEEEEEEKEDKDKKNIKRKKSSSTTPKFKVKSSIKKVFKHLLLTANGSLYGLQKSFHKKYVNNKRIVDVKCDGNRCTLCLDEDGALWSFGINLFGKLGLKRNDKKQIYTNPREISIFKAYKVNDFGITNRCCIAVCANGNIYGWGSYSKSQFGTDCNIWYTPRLISTNKYKWSVYAGFTFIILLNETINKLYVANTQFGYILIDKSRNGLIIKTQQIKLPKNINVSHVIPSNQSAIIITNG